MFKKLIVILISFLLLSSSSVFAETPTKLTMGGIFSTGVYSAWDAAFYDAFERVAAKKPHGLDMKLLKTEGQFGDNAEAAMRLYAKSGVDIIFGHGANADQVANIKDKYSDTMFAYMGSGNYGLGDNAYYLYARHHEPSYLVGVIAGSMTKSNVIGVVANFPADDINDQVNAFIAGAKSANSSVKVKVSYIDSWYDPVNAREAANAQISAGADQVFQLAESFEICEEKGILCYADYIDQNQVSNAKNVVTSTLLFWDPYIEYMVDTWYEHKTSGTPFNASKDFHMLLMKDGVADLAPYHNHENTLPDGLKAKVADLKQKIISGEFVVPIITTTPKSD